MCCVESAANDLPTHDLEWRDLSPRFADGWQGCVCFPVEHSPGFLFRKRAMMGRPHLRDTFGQIMPDRKLGAAVSDRLHAAVQRLACLDGLTEAAWIRGICEREVMSRSVEIPELTKSAGMYALVHKVVRKK